MSDTQRQWLLGEHARILNEHGRESLRMKVFLHTWRDDSELMSLCVIAATIKELLMRDHK